MLTYVFVVSCFFGYTDLFGFKCQARPALFHQLAYQRRLLPLVRVTEDEAFHAAGLCAFLNDAACGDGCEALCLNMSTAEEFILGQILQIANSTLLAPEDLEKLDVFYLLKFSKISGFCEFY